MAKQNDIPKWEDTVEEQPTWDETEPLKKKEESVSVGQSTGDNQTSVPAEEEYQPKLKLQGGLGDQMKGTLMDEDPFKLKPMTQKMDQIEYDLSNPEPNKIGHPWKVGYSNMVNAWSEAAKLSDYYFYQPNLMESISPGRVKYSTPQETEEFVKARQNALDNPVVGELMSNIIMKADVNLKPGDLPTGKFAERPEKWTGYLSPKRAYKALAENIPLMASFVGTSAVNPAFGAMLMGAVESGEANRSINDYEERTGEKVDPATREMITTSVGVINGLLEHAGLQGIMGKVPGAKGIIGKWIIATAMEGTTESLQELNQLLGEEAYNMVDERDWMRIADAGYGGILLGFFGGGGHAVLSQAGKVLARMNQSKQEKSDGLKVNKEIIGEYDLTSLPEDAPNPETLLNQMPNDYSKGTKKSLLDDLMKIDELTKKRDAAPEEMKKSFDDQINNIRNRMSETMSEEEGLIEAPEAPKEEKAPKVPPKKEKAVTTPSEPAGGIEETTTPPKEVIPKEEEIIKEEENAGKNGEGVEAPSGPQGTEEGQRGVQQTGVRNNAEEGITPQEEVQEEIAFTDLGEQKVGKVLERGSDKQGNFIRVETPDGIKHKLRENSTKYSDIIEDPTKIEEIKKTIEEDTSFESSFTKGAKKVDAWITNTKKQLDKFGRENLGVNLPVAAARIALDAMQVASKTAKTAGEVIDAAINAVNEWYAKQGKDVPGWVKDEVDRFIKDPGGYYTPIVTKEDIKDKLEEERIKKESEPKEAAMPFQGFAKHIFGKITGNKLKQRTGRGLFREYFRTSRGLPKNMYDEVLNTKGRVNARLYDVENAAKDALKKAKQVFGVKELTDEQLISIQTALENMGTTEESRAKALQDIPEELHDDLIRMREDIDQVTDELKKLEMIGEDLGVTFDKNRGYYLTRSYKKYTDENWTWNNIPDQIKEDAIGVLAKYYPEADMDELFGMARALLENSDIKDMVVGSKNFGKVDKSILKKRSKFLTDNPEIRALLGENKDPFYNYALSMTKMVEMAEKGKLLQTVRDMAIEQGWGSQKPSDSKNHIAKIEGDVFFKGKKQQFFGTGNPLSEFYVEPEVAEAINNFEDGQRVFIAKEYMRLVNLVKKAKTIYSIKSQVRNVKSNTFQYIANGNWANMPATISELIRRMGPKERRAFIRELKENMIIDDSAVVGEVVDNLKRMSDYMTQFDALRQSKTANGLKKADRFALKLYALGDDVWKTARYVSEYLRYKKAYEKTMSAEEAYVAAKERAKKVLHRTSTYYSMLPKIMQKLRNLPTNGTFISFPYLTTKNFIGTLQTAIEDLKRPETRAMGATRLMGTMASVATLTALASIRNKKEGMDDDDMEDLRRFMPDFWKNDIIMVTKNYGKGKYQYKNNTYLDYYNQVNKPMQMAYRDWVTKGEITSDDMVDIVGEILKPFMSWDILFNRLTNLKANQDDNGDKIWNEASPLEVRFEDQFLYTLDAFTPGTITDINRMRRTKKEGGNISPQVRGLLLGSQARDIDISKSLEYYMIPKMKEDVDNSRKIYKQALYKYNRIKEPTKKDKEYLNKKYDEATNALNHYIDEAREDYLAAKRLGLMRRDLEDMFFDSGLDTDVAYAITDGDAVMIDKELGTIEYARKRRKINK